MTQRTAQPVLPEFHITQEQLEAVSGGECTVEQWNEVLGGLRESYEQLIEFTSYVIERVVGQ